MVWGLFHPVHRYHRRASKLTGQMDALVQWLSDYGGWGFSLIIITGAGWLVVTGRLVPVTQVDREQRGQRDLATAVERMAESLDKNNEAVTGVQTAAHDLEKAQGATLHALEAIQETLEDFRGPGSR